MKGLTAIVIAAAISMLAGCGLLHPSAPATPVEADPWTDYHDGREAAAPPKHVEEKKAEEPAKAAEPMAAESGKTEAKLVASEDAPAPKPKKRAKGTHRHAAAGALAAKKPRKRSKHASSE